MNKHTKLQFRLDTLREKYGVVGASLAVLHNNQVEAVASGLLNLDTEVEATTDSVFQIGSISKVFTATLIMQLVDEGRLDLDQLVKTYLPSFHLADAEASGKITVRQLLCHTSGMEGDFFPEDNPFGASIAGFVDRCRLLPQLHPVGENFSYSNSGYSVAGRIVEVLTGLPWAVAITERILRPLEMQHSAADPSEVLRYRAAMGHVPDPQDPSIQRVAPRCYLPLSHAPAGSVLSMSAPDLLAFAKMHMNAPRNMGGKTILSEVSVAQMQQEQVSLPAHSPGGMTHWGLGWSLRKQGSLQTFGHYGATLGQFAYLNVLPEHGLVIALLTNSESSGLFNEIEKELMAELADIEMEKDPVPVNTAIDHQRYIGRYENIAGIATVFERDGELKIEAESKLMPSARVSENLQSIDKDCFSIISETDKPARNVHFMGAENNGVAQHIFSGCRLFRRVGE